ncbi:L-ribulose-5-phosphate 3-epimerase [Bifidobacterium sp. ESL0798]|uniref:L-ribulose-5-phosphate 3-epimerase n=1 Tax=Bifidobacterium sp. ESL0798 TaxID=2983235 RepID=UPI0023F7982B|nr:L-ribulose-5-phosphate 3-epimerase [Bifidobacterium sp. ESL0798]WEV74133.1 L-ribulose-5-phosphate 3-epimerase [Bifidobacterium sp. ESL0798]
MSTVRLGIYEKALKHTDDWDSFFVQVRDGGFMFMDISVDESPERMARLDWSPAQAREFRAAADRQGVQIGGMCLSCHRKVGPGSADPKVRQEADDIFRKAIDLCHEAGIPVVQVAGYYAYYEEPDAGQRARYVDSLRRAASYAAQAGVMLGIENVDGNDVTSITKGLAICDEIHSQWLTMYPDIGNLAEQQLDTTSELKAGEGRMLAIHVKDVLPGQPRRIPMGTGVTDFAAAFKELKRQDWSGRMMLEMWNDDAPNSSEISSAARQKVAGWLADAGIEVASR